MVDLDVVDLLLGVPAGCPTWRVADMASRARILPTWLSSAVARQLPLNPGAHAYLERSHQRMAELHATGEELAHDFGLRLIKGARIAAFLPPRLLRQSGDVDLVAPDEAALWRCALRLRERYGAVVQSVSLMEGPDGIHVGVAMKWPAAEPYLDKPMGADITTCAFAGDFAGVPIRVDPPPNDDLCGLFAVAEERFQRRFRVKDLLDLLVLAEALERRLGDRLTDVVCEHASRLALAPELRQLIRKADVWVPVSDAWFSTLAALGPLAEEEKELRGPDRPGMHRLLFGFPLDDVGSDDLAIRLHPTDSPVDGLVATTPLGACLLTDGQTLNAESVESAIRFARSLRTAAR
jgi:hypothetical protein